MSELNINWYPGHMAKTKRLISENIKVIDVVFEVLDARIPFSSKIKDIDKLLNNTPRIIILNKWDLCDQTETIKWVDYYQSIGYKVVTTNLITREHVDILLKYTNQIKNEVNRVRSQKGLKPRNLRALVVGIPNAGKSTLINTLVKHKAVNVANKPGVTKGLSWIRLKDNIELLDTPGILWPKFENQFVAYKLASLTAIKEEILSLQDIALFILNIMYQYYPNQLLERYQLKKYDVDNIEEVLETIGRNRQAITSGNRVDFDQVYKIIITDLKNGFLGPVTFDRLGETNGNK